ncbi:restriction endonuclease subunit S [Shewanella sp. UCD-KL21]|uniref:restriction endonuclease subunit S n=1 Tax=Shewanella sp. UCD-KL21 TaxID=1917164 RepID=UPI0009705997|nr:restriction endonuclease subunit S [Shewanella sp. UCD-KL21]USN27056.1 restriction endonuclease subunit S [synthetic construct]
MTFELKKLSDVCRLINGRAYKKHEMLAEGKYPLLRVGNFFTNRSWFYSDLELNEDKYCDRGDLLYAWSASFGPRIWDEGKVIYHYHIWKIELNESLVDKGYLYHLLEWDVEQIKEEQGTGTTMVHVTKGAMENRFLPFPSLQEQKRIVALLDTVFTDLEQARAKAEQNLKNARELFDSYLQQAYSQNGDGWVDKRLEDVLLDRPRNGWSPPAKNHSDIGVPVLTLSAVTGFRFNKHKVKFTSAAVKESAHYWVNNGDLLITRSNTPVLVGHVAICSNIEIPTIYPDLIMKLKLDAGKVDTKFIYYQLRSERLRKIITSSAQGANPTMKKINQGIVQSLPIRYPTIECQKEIVLGLDSIYETTIKLEKIYRNKLENLNELKKSILQKAFSGELTHD